MDPVRGILESLSGPPLPCQCSFKAWWHHTQANEQKSWPEFASRDMCIGSLENNNCSFGGQVQRQASNSSRFEQPKDSYCITTCVGNFDHQCDHSADDYCICAVHIINTVLKYDEFTGFDSSQLHPRSDATRNTSGERAPHGRARGTAFRPDSNAPGSH